MFFLWDPSSSISTVNSHPLLLSHLTAFSNVHKPPYSLFFSQTSRKGYRAANQLFTEMNSEFLKAEKPTYFFLLPEKKRLLHFYAKQGHQATTESFVVFSFYMLKITADAES